MTLTRPAVRASITLVLAAAACASVAPSPRALTVRQEPSAATIALFDRYLEALRVKFRIPGMSAAIVHDQRIVWDKGYGFQDVERRVAARADTPYRIASLTKTFTSTLLMGCVERRMLDLNDPISRYSTLIPEAGATVRHVLSHTSQAPAGSKFTYSGDRYVALTGAVDACTGRPFRQALATQILDPLAMRDSVPGQDLEHPSAALASLFDAATLERYAAVVARLAKPYTLDSKGRAVAAEYPPRTINASAGLISTVRDLAKFDAAIDRHLLMTAPTREAAWTPFVSTSGVAQPHALGWFVQQHRGARLVWHYGYWAQFSALYLKVPERGLTLLLLANSGELSSPFPMGAGDVTRSAFAQTFLKLFVE